MANKLEIDDLVLGHIRRILSGLEYGTVQITVHDGRIVQIDRTEKSRLGIGAASVANEQLASKER